MMNAMLVFKQMLILFAMMLAGYYCYRNDWLDENSYNKLSKIVVNILNPILVINGVTNSDIGSNTEKVLVNLALVLAYFVILIVLSYVVVKILKIPKSHDYLYRMMLIFSNVAFIAIPLITRIYGEGSVLYIAFYILVYNILLYTYGIYIASSRSGNENNRLQLKKLANPGVLACMIAIVIFVFKIPVSDSVKSFTDYMGTAAIPMSMMLIGASIAKANWNQLFKYKYMYPFLIIKMLVIPIIIAQVVGRTALPTDLIGIFVFMFAMPVGSIVVLLAMEYGADEECCTSGAVLSTLFSVISIPMVSFFL